MGHSIPDDMDGDPVIGGFKNDSEPAERDVETSRSLGATTSSQQLNDDVEDRLEDLVYLK